MTVEKINMAPSTSANTAETKKEEAVKPQISKSKGSTKDVVAVLSALSAISCAGIAIYKHKNAKEAIKKAEEEAKKKIVEAEEKAKKATEEAKKIAEETDKKIKEAVENVKKELNEAKEKTADTPAAKTTEASKTDEAAAEKEFPTIVKSFKTKTKHANTDRYRFRARTEKPVKANPPVIEPPKAEPQKAELPAAQRNKLSEQEELAQLDYYQGTDMAQVARNILEEKPAPTPAEIFKSIGILKPAKDMSEKELLQEFYGLKDFVKKLNTTHPASKRFFEIEGELINKRGYKLTKNGNATKKTPKPEIHEVEIPKAEPPKAEIPKPETPSAESLDLEIAEAELPQLTNPTKQDILKQEMEEAARLNAERDRAIAKGAKVLEGNNLDIELNEVYPGFTNQVREAQNGIIIIPGSNKITKKIVYAAEYLAEGFKELGDI